MTPQHHRARLSLELAIDLLFDTTGIADIEHIRADPLEVDIFTPNGSCFTVSETEGKIMVFKDFDVRGERAQVCTTVTTPEEMAITIKALSDHGG